MASPESYANDDKLYEIETIHHAERVGKFYKIFIKWVGSDQVTWKYRHHLLDEVGDTETLQQIEEACVNARARQLAEVGRPEDDHYSSDEEVDAGLSPTEPITEELGRGKRVRKQAISYSPSLLVAAPPELLALVRAQLWLQG
jgi:hypothetical protein